MTSILENVINEISQEEPNSPAAQLAEAAVNTAENPTPESIMADIETLISVFREIKVKLSGVHPGLITIFKALL